MHKLPRQGTHHYPMLRRIMSHMSTTTHHTLLHRDDIQVSDKVLNSRSSCSRSPCDRSLSERSSSDRSSSDRSSSSHSSNGRSNKGRSPNGSPTPRYTHRSRRTTESKRRSTHHHESRSPRPNSIESHGSAKEQRSKKK
jgi:activator of HSP90 ATPase